MSRLFALTSNSISLFVVLALTFGCVGCDRSSSSTATAGPVTKADEVLSAQRILAETTPAPLFKDFSRSNAVTLLLAEETEEHGLKHSFREKDGLTTIVKVDETPCRFLNMKDTRQEAYLYFTIDPAFKKGDVRNVKIEVEYFDVVFDDSPASFAIHYDSTGVSRSSNPAYKSANRTVRLNGSNKWQVATFQIRDAAFINSQNGRSDFRISVRPPEIYVRRVTVTRDTSRVLPQLNRPASLPAVEGTREIVTP